MRSLRLIDLDDYKDPPIEPNPPKKPTTLAQSFPDINYKPFFPEMRNPPLPIKLNKPSIRKLNSFEVQYFMELVKHHMIYTLDTLVAIYNQFSDIKNFTIDYEIVASNIPEKIEGKLHIIYED